ncbi:uncharacterized protein [Haliotis cracherodii]|uniref:uncharacterized protein n=1 Tax=Haliotis cracherodii TaxID=6455 RepID=UPI0039EBCC5C
MTQNEPSPTTPKPTPINIQWNNIKILANNQSDYICTSWYNREKPSCYTVSLGDPTAETFGVIKLIGNNKLRKRLLGFLTVISWGAAVIYDRCATHNTEENARGFFLNRLTTGIVYADRKGFWSMGMLFLPSSLRVGQVLSQRLLWEVGGAVGLIPKWDNHQHLYQTRNTSRVMKSLLKDVMDPWDCEIDSTLFQCVRELTWYLLYENMMTSDDKDLLQAWLSDLEATGYREPKRVNLELHCPRTLPATSGLMRPPLLSTSQSDTSNISVTMTSLCPQLKYSSSATSVITDIALIITFNSDKFYHNLPLLEAIHRRYFAYVIYCGPRQDRFKAKLIESIASSNILYIEGIKEGWYYMWECLTLTSKFNLDVRGYLQIGDDTLLNSWNIADLPRDRIWMPSHGRLDRRDAENLQGGWFWWKHDFSQKAVNRAMDTVVRIHNNEPGNNHVSKFVKTYTINSGDMSHVYQRSCDVMYIPSKMADQFRYLAAIFRKERVIVELTFPTLAHGLAHNADIYMIQGEILWDNDSISTHQEDLLLKDNNSMRPTVND